MFVATESAVHIQSQETTQIHSGTLPFCYASFYTIETNSFKHAMHWHSKESIFFFYLSLGVLYANVLIKKKFVHLLLMQTLFKISCAWGWYECIIITKHA